MSEMPVESKTLTIEIDGQSYQGHEGQMLIEIADQAGIPIPRFCYHKKLSVAANCRMCLVEVEKVGKPLPACATPINDGMKVFTKSPRAISAQQGTLEFLLINHPLDCPICDQGGECPLQEVTMGYGRTSSRYDEPKRAVDEKNIGPLISTEMTRCIHCTLCVRYGEEIAGIREMGATGRGENIKIGTYIEHSIASEMSGNIIDLCPVGALTSKPFRFSARPWELTNHESIAPHDCVGSNIRISTLRNEVLRVLPQENEAINEIWLSDRDRFSYEAVNSPERVLYPMFNDSGIWKKIDWEDALNLLVSKVSSITDAAGADQMGGLISPNATIEEHYLFQKLLRGLGSENIDHRLRQRDFSDQTDAPQFPWLGRSITSMEKLQTALLIGSDIGKEQPILSHRLRKAVCNGAQVFTLGPIKHEYRFDVAGSLLVSPDQMVSQLAAIAKVVLNESEANSPIDVTLQSRIDDAVIEEQHKTIAQALSLEQTSIFFGGQAICHPEFSLLRGLAALIEEASGAKVGYLPEGANAVGGCLAGSVPYQSQAEAVGLNAKLMFENRLKVYFLHDIEPEYDCGDSATALAALADADFVVAFSAYQSSRMQRYADLILPITPFTENAGTLVNIEGQWQSFTAAVTPKDEAKQAWKVYRVLGNLFQRDGFEYTSSSDVLNEVKTKTEGLKPDNSYAWNRSYDVKLKINSELTRIADIPHYSVDATVRRAESLQATPLARQPVVAKMSKNTAEKMGVIDKQELAFVQNGKTVALPLVVDDAIADNCVYIPAAVDETSSLGANFETVRIK